MVIMGLTTFAFVAGGSAKLAGVENMHTSFAMLGLPIWFGYFIGACEVAGGIGIWVRKLSALAAAGLFIIMLGAIYFHVTYTPLAAAIPALVLAIFAAFIFVKRRKIT